MKKVISINIIILFKLKVVKLLKLVVKVIKSLKTIKVLKVIKVAKNIYLMKMIIIIELMKELLLEKI